MPHRRIRVLAAAIAGAFLALSAAALAKQDASPRTAYRIELTGTVDPLIAGAVERAVRIATAADAPLLIKIDTPGGLDSAMRRIVKAVVNAETEVVCWVGPAGARAASAGAFIMMGCPVTAMAPGTNIGAASPVGFRGEVLSEKVTNDGAAYIRALAERWNRNADWAERAVRESVSIPAEEALAIGVIDRLAADEDSALGRTASYRTVPLTIGERIFHGLLGPDLAFLFFVLGVGLIAFEFVSPGGIGGLIGALFLISALIMLGMLPVNIAGAILIIVAMILFVIEAHSPGVGVVGAAGLAALILGGLFLFDASIPNARVSRGVIAVTAIATAAFFLLVAQAALKARRMPVTAGTTPQPGTDAVVVRECVPDGIVYAAGEEWSARSISGALAVGDAVRVVRMEGLTLVVEPAPQDRRIPTKPTEGAT